MPTEAGTAAARTPLNRDRVLRGAVEVADQHGIDAVTMRGVGEHLGVEAMSLYNHVDNKEDLLDGMVDVVIHEISAEVSELDLPLGPDDWKDSMRRRILTARRVLLRHKWVPPVLETRNTMSPNTISYFDQLLGTMLDAGFSMDLAHHAMHALGSRALGFTRELFSPESDDELGPETRAVMVTQMADVYPNISALIASQLHNGDDEDATLGWCDDQYEFEFGLDLILDGLERLRRAEWDRSSRTERGAVPGDDQVG